MGYATTMMKSNGPSHAVGHKSSNEFVMPLKWTSAYALQGNVCVNLQNQKPKSLDTTDVVRDVEKVTEISG